MIVVKEGFGLLDPASSVEFCNGVAPFFSLPRCWNMLSLHACFEFAQKEFVRITRQVLKFLKSVFNFVFEKKKNFKDSIQI